MDGTRIPKPSFKPPPKVAHPLPPSRPQLRAALHRRSKSVTDLRSAMPFKPLTRSWKAPEKPAAAAQKGTQKRTAQAKEDCETKAKVPKVRIPDWDYKSRFADLQKRHQALQEEAKETKLKILDFNKMETEVTSLRESFTVLKEKYDSQQNTVAALSEQNEKHLKENFTLKNNLLKKEEDYKTLSESHEKVQSENKENIESLKVLKEQLNRATLEIDELKKKVELGEGTIQQLKEDLEEHDRLRRNLHNTVQDMKGNIRVFCRVRPAVTSEEDEKLQCAIHYPSEVSLEIKKSRESVSVVGGKPADLKQEFNFDQVFSPEASQAEVFEELSQLVQSALDGYHVCVFAYGQTGSGKTYTMQGCQNNDGMIPRTVDLIFEKIHKLSKTDWTYSVAASFLEIYNENVRDLLVPNSRHNYELRFNEGRGVTVTNLQIVTINTAEDLKDLMDEAHKNRATAATDFNQHSSRSHAVTKIHLEGHNGVTNSRLSGSINLVDLAGSESAKTSTAERLTETKNINKSLATLGNVMLALHNKDSHIPYRNSKLTFLLQSCLGGNSKTLMFVNISPFEECYQESINSLRFASKVKDVKTVAKRNKTYCQPPSIVNF